MAKNLAQYFIDSTLVGARTAEVPNADWSGGGNLAASNAPGIGINSGNPDPKESDWSRLPVDFIQNSQTIGGAASGVFFEDPVGGDDSLPTWVVTAGVVAPDAVIKDVGGFDVYNRTGQTLQAGQYVWGSGDQLPPPPP